MSIDFTPRVAVLGREIPSADVRSVSWTDHERLPSFDDFNVVVIDLDGLPSSGRITRRAHELNRFLFAPERFPGELVVIGYNDAIETALGVFPATVQISGSVYSVSESLQRSEAEWLAHVRSFNYAFTGRGNSGKAWTVAEETELGTTDTSLGVGKAFRIRSVSNLVPSRPILALPPVTEGTPEEAIARLILTRYGFGAGEEAPAWITSVEPLPRLQVLKSEQERIDAQALALEKERQLNETAQEIESKFVGLLYEQGTLLEDLAADALELLGGQYVKPDVRNDTDGYLHGPHGVSAAVEVKGPKGQVGKKEVRQLDEWVDTAVATEPGTDWIGLLIANAERLTDPADRGTPLAPNALDLLNKQGYHVLTTIEIYQALINHQNGTFDQDAWWAEHLPPPPN